MFSVKLTHLRREEGNWYLRFSGNSFALMLEKLRALPRIEARWKPRYEWSDGKVGAWYVSERILVQISGHLSNLDDMKWLDDQRRIPLQVSTAMVAMELTDVPTSTDELKLAYRRMAKRYHPDLHGGTCYYTEKMKGINRANETLLAWLEQVSQCA